MRTIVRMLCSLLVCAVAAAQSPPNPFDKAPPDVEDALRARVREFYQDHVDGKFRKAEELVAEESKDGFYAANKPDLKTFDLGPIVFSDNYRKAKVTVVGKMMVMFMGLGAPRLTVVPFPSYWKIDGGKWCWYIYTDPNRMTPFGKANPSTGAAAAAAATDPAQGFKMPDLDSLRASVRADRTAVKLSAATGAEEKVIISNALPGVVSLQLERKEYPGLDVKLDKPELRGSEKATISIRPVAGKPNQATTIRVLVQPTNQAIEIHVSF